MAARIEFEGVTKTFLTGERATALRDIFPTLLAAVGIGKGAVEKKRFQALDEVSFQVADGEVLGIIGANGAGKSTTLKLTAGILRPNAGKVAVNGSISALIEVAAGFHPDLTGRENIFLNGSVLGLKRKVIRERLDEIIDFAELRDFIDTPVKRYSTGMYMRLGFSVAVHVDPDILLIDEVLAVGDLAFRRRCLERVKQLRARKKTILFVSHRMEDVRGICDRVIYLKDGKIHREGSALDVTRVFEDEMRRRGMGEVAGQPLSQRAGSSKVNITAVSLRDEAGRELESMISGAPLRVVVRVQADEPVDAPVLSVSLVRSDRVAACQASTKLLGPSVERLSGACEFEVLFDSVELTEDVYTVEAVVWNSEMIVPIAQFVHAPTSLSDHRPPLNRAAIFHPPARFTRVVSDGAQVYDEEER